MLDLLFDETFCLFRKLFYAEVRCDRGEDMLRGGIRLHCLEEVCDVGAKGSGWRMRRTE